MSNSKWTARVVSICLISKPNTIRFMFVGLDEERSLQKRYKLLSHIMDAAACIKKYQLRRTTCDLCT